MTSRRTLRWITFLGLIIVAFLSRPRCSREAGAASLAAVGGSPVQGSVYSVATVAGFGWLLLAMGLAQCDRDRPRTWAAYIGAFLAILLYREIPWLG